MLIKRRGIMLCLLLLSLFLSLLILNTFSGKNSQVISEERLEGVTEELKFLEDKPTSFFVPIYANSSELGISNTDVDVVLNISELEKIENLSSKVVNVARENLVENKDEDIKHIPSEDKEEVVVEVVAEVSDYISPAEVEVDTVEETKVKEEKKETAPVSNETTINVVPSIDNDNNIVISDVVEGGRQTTRGKFTFTYDPNVVYVNTENIESRFAVFAPNDDYNKVVKALAQMAFGEARGCSDTEIAATIWCVLNRYDAGYANSIFKVVTAKGQFHGYSSNHKVYDDIYKITTDVIARWVSEKEGATNIGRILPSDYLWFAGDGKHNYYRNEYKTSHRWDWSLSTPYIDWE